MTKFPAEEPPNPVRPTSRTSGEMSTRSTTPRPMSPDPLPQQPRASSHNPSERRPIGPRIPSPLPPQSPEPYPSHHMLPSKYDDFELESNPPPSSSSTPISNIPRSKRQPFFPAGNTETPKVGTSNSSISAPTPIEPLSIKKKTSVKTSAILPGSPTPARRLHVRNSPLNRNFQRIVSPRRVSPQIRRSKPVPNSYKTEDFEHIQHLAVSTKEDVSKSCNAFIEFSKSLLSRSNQPGVRLNASNWKSTQLYQHHLKVQVKILILDLLHQRRDYEHCNLLPPW